MLEYIGQFIGEHDYPPSIRQIQEACQISSTSVVDYNLRILEREGYIRRDREVSRAIELLGRAGPRRSRIIPVSIIGTIAAGQPIPVPSADAWNNPPDEVIELPPEMLGHREKVYALRVKGNSMIDALVNDGDIVILEAASTADEGEMVAAWLRQEQEATLKRFYRQGSRVRLQPANAALEPIYTKAGNVEIQGKVVACIRPMR
jgi:repressor LexA